MCRVCRGGPRAEQLAGSHVDAEAGVRRAPNAHVAGLLAFQYAPVGLPALNLLFVLDGQAELGQTKRDVGVLGQECLAGLLGLLELICLPCELYPGRLQLVGIWSAVAAPRTAWPGRSQPMPPSAGGGPCAGPKAPGPRLRSLLRLAGSASAAWWRLRAATPGVEWDQRPVPACKSATSCSTARSWRRAWSRSAERSGGSKPRSSWRSWYRRARRSSGDWSVRPALAAFLAPGPGQAAGGVTDVGGDHVHVALASGPAHGHVGQLPAAAVFQGVGGVHGLALGPVGGDAVGVSELVGPDVARAHVQLGPFGCHRH